MKDARPDVGGSSRPLPGSLSDHIEQNVATIAELLQRERDKDGTRAHRHLDNLGRMIGQPVYLLSLLALIVAWVVVNTFAPFLGLQPIDRPPFQLLQGLLTLIALLTSTTVLIAQNREARLEQQREHLELQINLLTEQKVTRLISLIEELRRDLPMVHDRRDPQTEMLQQATDTAQVISALKEGGVAGEHMEDASGEEPKSTTV